MIHKRLRLITILISQKMAPCYVVFHGKQPRIYIIWYECSEQVLGVKNARYLKYNNYQEAVRDFNASLGAATPLPSMLLPDERS
jgi:viroplasmin and RNaseH domain-containing protein